MKSRNAYKLIALFLALTCALVGMLALAGCSKTKDTEPPSLSVSEDQITSIVNMKETKGTPTITKTIALPANSIIEVDAKKLAAVRTKTDKPHPLATLGVVNLNSGATSKLLSKGISHDDGYDITDARLTESMALWVETKATTSAWRLYRASLINSKKLGDPVLLAEGDETRQSPSIAAIGNTAIWVDALVRDLRQGGETSYVYATEGTGDDKRAIFETTNPIICPLTRSGDTITVVDWAPKGGSRRSEAHAIDIATGEERAILRIPGPIELSEAIWFGDNAWSFSVPALYNSAGALGQVGTYIQTEESTYTRFPKAPLDTPAKVSGKYLVKNGKSIISYDADKGTYMVVETPKDAPDYGEYIAVHGEASKAVLFTQKMPEDESPSTATIIRELKP